SSLSDLGLIYCDGGKSVQFGDPFRQIASYFPQMITMNSISHRLAFESPKSDRLLEPESRRRESIDQGRDAGIEAARNSGSAALIAHDQLRFHHRRAADDHEQAAVRLQCLKEAIVEDRTRSCHGNGIELAGWKLPSGIHHRKRDVVDAGTLELRCRGFRKVWKYIDARHRSTESREASGQEPGARTDFEHLVIRLDREHLQQPPLDGGRHHEPSVRQWDRHVRESHVTEGGRHEFLARQFRENVEHFRVGYFEGSYLLPQHLLTGEFSVHSV